MRHIRKRNPPYCLTQRQSIPQTAIAAEKAWGNFSSDCCGKVGEYLIAEQYHLCAYTELNLDEFQNDLEQANIPVKLGYHIEHVKPKSQFPLLTFDYNNLVASCLDSDSLQGFAPADRFGGHYKRGEYDAQLFVSPLESDCQKFFSYELTGKVKPSPSLSSSDQQRAEYTIKLLNLTGNQTNQGQTNQSHYLVLKRRKILEEANRIINDLWDENELEQSREAIRQFADAELGPTCDKLNSFWSARYQQFTSVGLEVVETTHEVKEVVWSNSP